MPLLEIKQIRQVTVTFKADEEIAKDVDIYASMVSANPDEVINNALAYVFARDKDLQEFKRTENSKYVPRLLRVKPKNGAHTSHNGLTNGKHT